MIHSDEQFYLLTGDRLLHGALPFVDIWDRKPIGLFILFAAIRLLGGVGVVEYQLVATGFAIATALLVSRIAAPDTGGRGGLAAALAYLVWLDIFDGAGGQSAVFYNLPVTAAALLTLRSLAGDPRRVGPLVMLLIGVAIQLKYTVIVEGVFFGLVLMTRMHRIGVRGAAVLAHAAGWVGIAIAPTGAAWLVYAILGHGGEFVFANFVSIFRRLPDATAGERAADLLLAVLATVPLLAAAAIGVRRSGRGPARHMQLFALSWAAAAFAAILLVGSFKGLYFLPLVPPLAIAAAPGLARMRVGLPVLLVGCVVAALTVSDHVRRRGTARQVDALTALIGRDPPGCLFSFRSEPILYHLTGSCLPTRYPFRSHLSDSEEAPAIGVDPVAEVARVLAGRPGVIVVREAKPGDSPAAAALVSAALARDYRLVGAVRVGSLVHRVYRLRPALDRAGS